jgi:outer membrane immunogenic protein
VLAPAYDWSGFYLGVNVGLGLGRDLSNITNITALQSSTAYLGPIGAIGGAQAGYNWQTGDWVFGLETDIGLCDAR